MNEKSESAWVTLLRACAAIAPALVTLYYVDESFRRRVDEAWAQLRYRARVGHWMSRVGWHSWRGWQRELWENRHGPLEG